MRLDGSHSKGHITRYLWQVSGSGGCPERPRAVQKSAKIFAFRALCDLKAKLTVFGPSGDKDSAETTVMVKPREGQDWSTPVRTTRLLMMDPAYNPDPIQFVPTRVNGLPGEKLNATTGQNEPDCAGAANTDSSKVLCPNASRGSWRNSGYSLTQLHDPGGPFDRWFYVARARFAILAKAQFNHWIWPGSANQPGADVSFYTYNLQRGAPIDEFLTAVKEHEADGAPGVAHSGHASSFREFIAGAPEKRDPRKLSEAAIGSTRAGLSRRLDLDLHTDEHAICASSEDPLASIFNKALYVWSTGDHVWVSQALTVGGGPQSHVCHGVG